MLPISALTSSTQQVADSQNSGSFGAVVVAIFGIIIMAAIVATRKNTSIGGLLKSIGKNWKAVFVFGLPTIAVASMSGQRDITAGGLLLAWAVIFVIVGVTLGWFKFKKD